MRNLLIITQKVDKNDQLLGFFIDWISRFAQKFDKVTVLCLEKGEFNLPPNVKIISLGKDRRVGKLKQFFTFYFLLFTLCKNYDAVFVHMNPIWVVLGGFWWRMTKKKVFFWYTSGGVTAKLKLAEKFADIIFTASKESFRLPSKKVIVTGHGIDTDLFRPTIEVKPQLLRFNLNILSIGRISPVKNYEVLIDAVKILKNRGIDVLVTMIGEAPLKKDKNYEESLKFKVKSLKLEDNFNFIGKVNHKNLPAYYQSHDLFIHLSKTGSLDKTVLEAIACEMKVLSSNDASKSFLPQNLIFNDKNSEELANKIMIFKDLEPSSSLREYVIQNHNLDNLINKIAKIINE